MKQDYSNQLHLWRSEDLFNIDFASYTLSHHSFPRHFHDHFVIELVIAGADNFYCEGRNHTAASNQLVLINPGEVHTGSTVGNIPLHYFSLYPDFITLQQIAAAVDIVLPVDFRFPGPLLDQPALAARFLDLFRSFQVPGTGLLQQELFFDCMKALFRVSLANSPTISSSGRHDSRVRILSDYIHKHSQEELSLRDMAMHVSMNPFHLVRVFKKSVGLSPYEYLLVARTEKAKHLLRSGYKVQEAALEAGFYDSSHLNRLLRKFGGTSPKSFLSSKGQYHTIFNA